MLNNIKIHILFDFVDGAWGGGNQFLKAIKEYMILKNIYTDDYNNADVIIINSYNNFQKAMSIKLKNNKVKIVHRIDGPISYYRDDGVFLDKIIFTINRLLADGTIFQSKYTKQASLDKGMNLFGELDSIILNAPNPKIFYEKTDNSIKKSKIRLIATSWSGNIKKGFDVYSWLDKNLDFNKYDMVFIGNTPIKFNNIEHKQPMNSNDLSDELRKSDIFIFASKIESCSNSLLEALHCGLPTIAYDSSSMPEIVKDGGELFKDKNEIPKLLEKISNNYTKYKENISLPKIDEIGLNYVEFCQSLQNEESRKKINLFSYIVNITILRSIFIIKKIYMQVRKIVEKIN